MKTEAVTVGLALSSAALTFSTLWLAWQWRAVRQMHVALTRYSANLEATLDTMSQGVALFDSQERILVSNRAFALMYGMDPHEVSPGTSLREVLERRAARGIYAGTTVDAILTRLRERLSRKSVTHWTAPFADGRTIVVSTQPRPDGSWVNTHLDITERERLREQLDAALGSMAEGIAMFDADRKLLLANVRYSELYDLPRGEVLPGVTLNILTALAVRVGTLDQKQADVFEEQWATVTPGERSAQYRLTQPSGRIIDVTVTMNARGGIVTCHRDVTAQCVSDARIAHMALHDMLTGLPNRVLMRERIEYAVKRAQRTGEKVAVHALDLDHFKAVNDTLGHAVGDALLSEVAQRLSNLVRATDTVARLGGDEFAIVQVDISSAGDAAILAERIIKVLQQPYKLNERDVMIGVSVGIALAPDNSTQFDTIMRQADVALYRSKGTGRGRYCYYDTAMDTDLQLDRVFEKELAEAVRVGGFELHYQPLYRDGGTVVSGFEALIRWHHPDRGLVSPGEFIPVAERTGLIHGLGAWVLRKGCETALQWPEKIRIAVNVSPIQLREQGFVDVVAGALSETGLAPHRLELEITESALLESQALSMLAALRGLGVRLALDDFGAGFSSLASLRTFRFDRVKIDGTYVRAPDGVNPSPLFHGMAALVQQIGIEITAEGIESEAQMNAVIAEGCSEMQGFYLARPAPAESVASLLDENENRLAAVAVDGARLQAQDASIAA